MKITQNSENLERKETKLTKFFWLSRTFVSFAIFCNCLFLFSAAGAKSPHSKALRESVNGADGIRDVEGKAARVAAS